LINKEENLAYLGLTQTPYGGYGKVEGSPPGMLSSDHRLNLPLS
jgi:hypothetical protein